MKSLKNLSQKALLAAVFLLSTASFALVRLFPSLFYHELDTASYLVFHNIAEFFSIMVSFSIFGVGWFTFEQSGNRHALFLSCAFLAIGLMDFMHTLSFPGMPDFITPSSTAKGIQFWLFARVFSASAFLASAFIDERSAGRWVSRNNLFAASLAIPLLVFCAVIYYPAGLPQVFIEGTGLTPFKKNAEYVIDCIFGLSFAAYWRLFSRTGSRLFLYYLSAIILSIFSELAFTLYKSAFDTYNMLGHIYKVFAFYLIYKGVFSSAVTAPYLEVVDRGEEIRRESEERRKAEDLLGRSEERFRNLVDTTSDWIWEVDERGLYTYASPAVTYLLGYGPKEVLGKTPFDFMPPEEAERVSAAFSSLVTERKPITYLENINLRRDGSRVIIETCGVPFFGPDGIFRGYRGVNRDITVRKLAEEELRFKNIILSTQQEVSIDGILVVDDKGTMVSFNQRFVEMWGIPPEVVASRSDEAALQSVLGRLVAPEEFLRKVQHLYEHRTETSRDELPLKDGRIFDRYSAPMFGNDGAYYGRVWYFRDITERKQAEEALKKLNEELDIKVKERTAELEAKIVEVERLNKAFIGREMRIIELKERIKELENRI